MPSIIRPVLFSAIFVYSPAFLGIRADELTGPPPPLPVAIGEHVTADAVDLIFLFDHVASDRGIRRSKATRFWPKPLSTLYVQASYSKEWGQSQS